MAEPLDSDQPHRVFNCGCGCGGVILLDEVPVDRKKSGWMLLDGEWGRVENWGALSGSAPHPDPEAIFVEFAAAQLMGQVPE